MNQLKDRLSEWIKTQDSTICQLEETYFKYKETYLLKVNGWRNIYHANINQEKARVAVFISDRPDFKARKVIRYTERHYILLRVNSLRRHNNP